MRPGVAHRQVPLAETHRSSVNHPGRVLDQACPRVGHAHIRRPAKQPEQKKREHGRLERSHRQGQRRPHDHEQKKPWQRQQQVASIRQRLANQRRRERRHNPDGDGKHGSKRRRRSRTRETEKERSRKPNTPVSPEIVGTEPVTLRLLLGDVFTILGRVAGL